jgi:hypothetical protein
VALAAPDPLELELLYSPHAPEPPQHAFLMLDELGIEEALYGGAAGGGKSDAMLMSALRYVNVPGYAALLLRKSYADLAKPGALMDRAKSWLAGRADVAWSERDFRFTFPSGARLDFGYLQTRNDRYTYQSAEYQFVGFDELTQFEEADYTYLFSRIRRPELPDHATPEERLRVEALTRVPLRMRGATNPGNRGHEWVKRRFIDRLPSPDDPEDSPAKARARIFIPARLADNPHVDRAGYERMLGNLTGVERARLRDGDWNADDGTRYLNGNGLDAAAAIGAEYDELAKLRPGPGVDALELLPAPAGGHLVLGVDFGDHTFIVLAYPLESGGLWVVAAVPLDGVEAGAKADRALELLQHVPVWPGRPNVRNPLYWLEHVAYDSAGLESMRTFAKRLRQRRPDLGTFSVPFGSYKRETALYLKALVERARDGHRTRILAISAVNCVELMAQLRELRKDPKDAELWIKENDHGPDALVAALADIARRNRATPAPTKQQQAEAERRRIQAIARPTVTPDLLGCLSNKEIDRLPARPRRTA